MKSIFGALALLLMTGSALAQQWTPTTGPEGGSVVAMAADASTVLAAISPGVLYRHEAGPWQRLGPLTVNSLHAVGGAFIGTGVEQLYRSTDRGDSWQTVGPTGLGMKLAVDRDLIYAGVDSAIHRSTDGGVTWARVASTGMDFYAFMVRDSVMLIARGNGRGVYRSSDFGATWSHVTAGIPDTIAPQAFHRQGADLLMAMDGHGVLRSTDAGASWSPMNTGLPRLDGTFPFLQSFVNVGDRIWVAGLGGTFAYVDGRWRVQSLDNDYVLAARDGKVFRGSRRGITVAADTGSWRMFNDGLMAHRVSAIARFGNAVLTSAAGMIFRTTDGGGFWTPAAGIETGQFAVANDRVAYAVGRNYFKSAIFRTVDGLDWGEVGAAGLPHPLRWIGAIAAGGDTVFIGYNRYNWEGGGPTWEYGGVYRSLDRGATWSAVNQGLPNDGHGDVPVRDLILLDGVLIAQTADGIHRSTDGGQSWTRVHPAGVTADMRGISTTVGSTIYLVASSGTVLRSDDHGATWSQAGSGIPESANVMFLSSSRGALYASALIDGALGRVFRLADGRWTEITSLLPSEAEFQTFLDVGERTYVATAWNSVWRGTFDPPATVGRAGTEAGIIDLEAYPNPVRGGGIVRFTMKEAGRVRMSLVSALGREVALLHEGAMASGAHELPLPTEGLAAGLYRVRLSVDGRVRTVAVVKE